MCLAQAWVWGCSQACVSVGLWPGFVRLCVMWGAGPSESLPAVRVWCSECPLACFVISRVVWSQCVLAQWV